jgi:hypothetical protein
MGKPRAEFVIGQASGWEPTLTQVAERANALWHEDGCPAAPELGYWLRARAELKEEHRRLIAAENATATAVVGMTEAGIAVTFRGGRTQGVAQAVRRASRRSPASA